MRGMIRALFFPLPKAKVVCWLYIALISTTFWSNKNPSVMLDVDFSLYDQRTCTQESGSVWAAIWESPVRDTV